MGSINTSRIASEFAIKHHSAITVNTVQTLLDIAKQFCGHISAEYTAHYTRIADVFTCLHPLVVNRPRKGVFVPAVYQRDVFILSPVYCFVSLSLKIFSISVSFISP